MFLGSRDPPRGARLINARGKNGDREVASLNVLMGQNLSFDPGQPDVRFTRSFVPSLPNGFFPKTSEM